MLLQSGDWDRRTAHLRSAWDTQQHPVTKWKHQHKSSVNSLKGGDHKISFNQLPARDKDQNKIIWQLMGDPENQTFPNILPLPGNGLEFDSPKHAENRRLSSDQLLRNYSVRSFSHQPIFSVSPCALCFATESSLSTGGDRLQGITGELLGYLSHGFYIVKKNLLYFY